MISEIVIMISVRKNFQIKSHTYQKIDKLKWILASLLYIKANINYLLFLEIFYFSQSIIPFFQHNLVNKKTFFSSNLINSFLINLFIYLPVI